MASEQLVKFTRWLGANRPEHGKLCEVPWSRFCDNMRELGERGITHPMDRRKPGEASVRFPCFTFGSFRDGYRDLAHFEGSNAIGLDFDDGALTFVNVASSLYGQTNALWFLYTTKSHTQEQHALRLMFLLSRYVTADEHCLIRAELDLQFGRKSDPNAKDAVRLWWEPTKPYKADFAHAQGGLNPLDVEPLLEQARERIALEQLAVAAERAAALDRAKSNDSKQKTAIEPTKPITSHTVKDVKRANAMLANQCGKVALAPPGAREETLRKAAALLGGKPSYMAILGRQRVLASLITAAEHCGLPHQEATDKATRALEWGEQHPLDDLPQERSEKEGLYFPARDEGGKPKASAQNTVIAFTKSPRFAPCLAYDTFADRVTVVSELPDVEGRPVPRPLTDQDVFDLRVRTSELYGFEPAKDVAFDAVYTAARLRPMHPVRDWLRQLEWDGEARLAQLFPRYFGCTIEPEGPNSAENLLVAARVLMISACARVERPGCKVDTTIVLHGPQGWRKSSAIAALCGPDWFLDAAVDVQNKDALMQLRGRWFCELSELSSIRKADMEHVKGFLSRAIDVFRPPYGRETIEQPRQCVFVGTSNDYHPFTDRTGNRRFVSVLVREHADTDAIERDREQLWAEAIHWYREGVKHYLTREEEAARVEIQAQFQADSGDESWREIIGAYLAPPTRVRVTARELLELALRIEVGRISKADEMRVCAIMREHEGWERKREMVDGQRARWFVRKP